jgi:hypothetical protein
LLGELLDPVVERIYNIKVVILVESYARGPVQLTIAAAVLAETAEVLAICAENANPLRMFIGQEKVSLLAKGNTGNPDKPAFIFSPLAKLVNVLPVSGALSYPHRLPLVGVGPAGYIEQVVRAQGNGHRAAETGLPARQQPNHIVVLVQAAY